MDYVHVMMAGVPRKIHFPFPIQSIGHISSLTQSRARNCYRDKVEFCVRLASSEKCAVDILDGTVWRTPFPHVIIKAPGVVHEYEICAPREALYFMYDRALIPGLAECGITLNPPIWPITLNSAATKIIASMRELTERSMEGGAAEELDIRCFEFLTRLVLMRNPSGTGGDDREGRIRQAASYLQLHWSEFDGVEKLSRRFSMSRRTFYRAWTEFVGGTPAEFVNELALTEARRLLEETALSMTEIAYKLKYADSAYFISKFRRRYGCTPLVYRKRNR